MTFEHTLLDLLGRGLAARFRARGHSMHPTIRCGEHVRVDPVEAWQLAPGDVVLARHARGLTAHRVVRIDGARITTRGDNCSHDDPSFNAEQLLGRVAGVPSRSAARARWWVRRALTNISRRARRLTAVASVAWQSVF